jgi:CRP/FNR family cyclic AMP-dependent transcriptional regulator
MTEDKSRFVPFLNRLTLLRKLTPAQVEKIVDYFDPIELEANQRLFSQGELGDSLYILVSGKVRVSRGPENKQKELATFVSGDAFGEESLIYNQPRTATVTAVDPSQLLRLGKENFSKLIREYPYLKSYLTAIVKSRRMARKSHFDWLAPGETIYLMARKHPAALLVLLILPSSWRLYFL